MSFFVFFTTTMSVSFTLRETQTRMLKFTGPLTSISWQAMWRCARQCNVCADCIHFNLLKKFMIKNLDTNLSPLDFWNPFRWVFTFVLERLCFDLLPIVYWRSHSIGLYWWMNSVSRKRWQHFDIVEMHHFSFNFQIWIVSPFLNLFQCSFNTMLDIGFQHFSWYLCM